MTCSRCQGLMHEDHFFDLKGTQGLMWMKGWRCLNCGHAVDPVLEANRRLQRSTGAQSTSDQVLSRPAASGPEHSTGVDTEAA